MLAFIFSGELAEWTIAVDLLSITVVTHRHGFDSRTRRYIEPRQKRELLSGQLTRTAEAERTRHLHYRLSLCELQQEIHMVCHNCQIQAKRFGKDRKGNQRFRCNTCRKTFQSPKDKPLGSMYLPIDKALMCLHLLVEGMSVRSIQRITGVHRDTVLDLLVRVGEKCEQLLDEKIRKVKVKDIQLDEIWAYVEMKEKTKNRKGKGDDDQLGDAYTFVAFERESKLILAWHLGRRTSRDTVLFVEKIFAAVDGTEGRIQVSTDGFAAYPDAIAYSLGTRADYAQLIKIYGAPEPDEHRYSPSHVIEAIPQIVFGNPDPDKICTSHVERQNLNIRMAMRRFTRLTNAFSKKWENLKAALALYFAYYNFCRIHSTIRCTPAMEAGITKSVWSLKDLLIAATQI